MEEIFLHRYGNVLRGSLCFFMKYIEQKTDLSRGFYWLAITINEKRSLLVEWYTVRCRSYYVDSVAVQMALSYYSKVQETIFNESKQTLAIIFLNLFPFKLYNHT